MELDYNSLVAVLTRQQSFLKFVRSPKAYIDILHDCNVLPVDMEPIIRDYLTYDMNINTEYDRCYLKCRGETKFNIIIRYGTRIRFEVIVNEINGMFYLLNGISVYDIDLLHMMNVFIMSQYKKYQYIPHKFDAKYSSDDKYLFKNNLILCHNDMNLTFVGIQIYNEQAFSRFCCIIKQIIYGLDKLLSTPKQVKPKLVKPKLKWKKKN